MNIVVVENQYGKYLCHILYYENFDEATVANSVFVTKCNDHYDAIVCIASCKLNNACFLCSACINNECHNYRNTEHSPACNIINYDNDWQPIYKYYNDTEFNTFEHLAVCATKGLHMDKCSPGTIPSECTVNYEDNKYKYRQSIDPECMPPCSSVGDLRTGIYSSEILPLNRFKNDDAANDLNNNPISCGINICYWNINGLSDDKLSDHIVGTF